MMPPTTELGDRIDKATLRALAAEIECDPRSIEKELKAARGEEAHVKGMAGHRIRRALAAKGLIAVEASK